MSEWINIIDKMPKPGQAVLAQRAGDLYPVVAFWLPIADKIIDQIWYTAHEGPEDRYEDLTRELISFPTHWMPLPEPPKLEESKGEK